MLNFFRVNKAIISEILYFVLILYEMVAKKTMNKLFINSSWNFI